MLKGNLTYLTAIVSIVFGIIGLIFGWLEQSDAMKFILGGLGGFGMRRAIGGV